MAHSTKPCPYCFQEVDSRTRKCPHCLSVQGTFMALIVFIIFLIAGVGGLAIYVIENRFESLIMPSDSVESRTDLVKQIEIVRSELLFGQLKDGLTVGTIGMLKNHADVRVTMTQLEVQYYDASGKLIDVNSMDRYPGITIAPGGEAAFKISELADQPKDSYASHKVFVLAARLPY